MSDAPSHIVITGAAGAIGGALAQALAGPDAKITLVDRDAAGAERRAASLGGECAVRFWDLADVGSLDAAWAELVAARGPVDVLVNCAGFMEIRSFVGTSWNLGLRLLNVDLVAPLKLMHLALPSMIERKRGTVVNVASMAGRTPIRGMGFYGAAKSGLAMASEIARLELAPRGVRVITVYPGPIHSPLEARGRSQVPPGFVARHIPTGDPDAIAARIAAAIRRGSARVIHPHIYVAANAFLGIAAFVTSRLSPEPLE